MFVNLKEKSGFTLVELLVVISIIALLLAMLMPALNSAKEQANVLKCQSNLRQLGMAWTIYATNNDGFIVSALNYRSDDDSDLIRYKYTRSAWVWAPTDVQTSKTVLDFRVPTLEQRQEGIRRGKLFNYTKNVKLYHCPKDKSGHFRSYSIPDCMNGEQGFASGAYKKPWDSLTSMNQIRKASQKYVFVEEKDFRNYNMDSWMVNAPIGQNFCEGDPIPVWHTGKSCFAFADGHAEIKKWAYETVEYYKSLNTFQPYLPKTQKGIDDTQWIARGWARKYR